MRAVFVMSLIASSAMAAVSGEWRVNLLKGSTVQTTVTAATQDAAWNSCQMLIPKSAPAAVTYTCQAPRYVANVTPDPVQTCTTPKPADETQTVACPAGTTGSWTQTRTYQSAPFPTCWTPAAWQPSAPPSGSCSTPTTTSSVLYTDMTHAPAGAPLTVCGTGFGLAPSVSISGVAAQVLQAQASLRAGIDCVRVKADRSGVVSVNGSPSAVNFTVQPGDILYVSLTGNDSTAVKNDPAHPWRHVQLTSSGTAALGAANPGDIIMLRGGTWSDVGVDKTFVRIWAEDGKAPNGIKGTGFITITGYPGEQVKINAPIGGGIMGAGSARAGVSGRYFVISNLTIVVPSGANTDAAPINLQYASDNWRVVNNDLTWPNSPSGAKAGGLTGHGVGAKILGNYIHDIGGGQENHGIYVDTGSDMEFGWNAVQRVAAGNLFQTYDGTSNIGIQRISVHDNLLTDGGRYGLNVATQTRTYEAWGNTVKNTALAGLRFDIDDTWSVDLYVHDNTFENVNTKGSGSSDGSVNCDWKLTKATRALVTKNSFSVGAGAKEYYEEYGSCPALKFSGNTWTGLSGPNPDQ